jgi:hypothetical protein
MNNRINVLKPFNVENESPIYYTKTYEIRIVKTLCAFIAANGIILLSFILSRFQAAALGVVHGYILGMILSYQIFGITCKKRSRRVIGSSGLRYAGIALGPGLAV